MFDQVYARSLVRHLPITIEQYPSGQIGFVARPLINGKRFNKSFSTSVYPSLEEASQAAIAYCREMKAKPPTEESKATKEEFELEALIKQAKALGIDHIKAFRAGLMLAIRRRSIIKEGE